MVPREYDLFDKSRARKLSAIKLTYNSMVHWSIGVTPALAFIERELKIPISLAVPKPALYALHTWVGQLKDRYTKIMRRMYRDSIEMYR